jgi:hypothetical protein
MAIPPHQVLKAFDIVEFDGSTNVASVRKITTQDGQPVAHMRYINDDGSLEFAPFTMTVAAIRRICTICDSEAYTNTRRPAQIGRATERENSKPEDATQPMDFQCLQAWARVSIKAKTRTRA